MELSKLEQLVLISYLTTGITSEALEELFEGMELIQCEHETEKYMKELNKEKAKEVYEALIIKLIKNFIAESN